MLPLLQVFLFLIGLYHMFWGKFKVCELFNSQHFGWRLKNCNVSWLNHRTFLGSNMRFITIWGGLHSHNDRGMITAAYDENRSGFDPKVKSSWISTSATTVKLLDFSDIFHEIKHDNWIMIPTDRYFSDALKTPIGYDVWLIWHVG